MHLPFSSSGWLLAMEENLEIDAKEPCGGYPSIFVSALSQLLCRRQRKNSVSSRKKNVWENRFVVKICIQPDVSHAGLEGIHV